MHRLAKQASEAQKKRHWKHQDTYTGYNCQWIEYCRTLEQEATSQMHACKEGTSQWKTLQRTAKYFGIIYTMNLNSGKEIEECAQMIAFLEGVEHHPLPSAIREEPVVINRITVDEDGTELLEEVEVSSDVEDVETGSNWIANHSLRELAMQLEAIMESSTSEAALQSILEIGHPRERNGFIVAKRLADVFGRGKMHHAMFPVFFDWGKNGNSLAQDWALYKAMVDSGYTEKNEGHEQIVIGCALKGFRSFHHHTRLTDHIRTRTPKDTLPKDEWKVFRDLVDNFFGDVHKQAFQDSVFDKNINMAEMMACAGITDMESINQVSKNSFGSKFTPINADKNKGKGDVKFKFAASNPQDADGKNQKKSSKRNKIGKGKGVEPERLKNQKCGWCKQDHSTQSCKNTEKQKQWLKVPCKRCKGAGHPIELCPNPA